MKVISIALFLVFFSCLSCFGEQLLMSRPRSKDEVSKSKFYAYKDRMNQRRSSALELRRIYNSGKVHKYWTAMVYPVRYNSYYYNTGSRPVYIRRSDFYYESYYQYRR